jgi:hypothetical protein
MEWAMDSLQNPERPTQPAALSQRPIDQLVAGLGHSKAALWAELEDTRADRDGWKDLAISRGADNAVLRTMLSQSLTLLHTRERADAKRTGRVVRLLDDAPHVRASIAAGWLDECQRLCDQVQA